MPGQQNQRILRRENPDNKMINKTDVKTILGKYGLNIPVNNIELFRRAFVHRSYLKSDNYNIVEESVAGCTVPLQEACNERLELLGDCILGSVVGTYLFTRYKDQPEGFLTKTKTKIVRGKTLGRLSKRMEFGKWVIISLHVENEGGRHNYRILEDLFECFVGALYLDNGGQPFTIKDWETLHNDYLKQKKLMIQLEQEISAGETNVLKKYVNEVNKFVELSNKLINTNANSYQICQQFIMSVLEREIDLVKLIMLDDNYKDQIQRLYLDQFGTFPEWQLLKTDGPTNNRYYTVGIHDDRGVLIGKGCARKKIEAEQLASKVALKHFGVEIYSDSEDEEEYYMKNKNK